MTPERFRAIIEAYGAEPQRWPATERAAAEDFARGSLEANALLLREAELDDLLGRYRVQSPGSALTGAVVASAPPFQKSSSGYLLKGFGFIGAGLAGAIAGALLMMMYTPPAPSLTDRDERPILTSFDVGVSELDLGETQ